MPRAASHCVISSSTSSAARGRTKLAVPTCTAAAPTARNSSASRPVMMPPEPSTGMLTAPAAS